MLPAIAGAILIYLACRLVQQLGGGKWAIAFTGVGLLFSPALLGTNSLYQPVSFNQFCWFLTAYIAVQIVRQQDKRWWYALGLVIGLGFLTKYSIVFYVLALLGGVLMTPQRKILLTSQVLIAGGIALLIAMPNLFWQYEFNWPVLRHMQELQETQLVHMDWSTFLAPQLLFHFTFSIIWIAGLIGLFRTEKLKPFRFTGIALFITIALIGFLSGKDYYTIGAYYILFPFGGLVLESVVPRLLWRVSLVVFMIFMVLPVYPYILPLLKVEQLHRYCAYMQDNYGMEVRLRWEDGVMHDIPQDVADMHGWDEMVEKVAKLYHSLTPEEQSKCHIYGGSYGHAGAINYYRKKYKLPKAASFSSSYVFWAPKEVDFDRQILIDNRKEDSSQYFANVALVDSVENEHARDPGYIYYRTEPKMDVSAAWRRIVEEMQAEAGVIE